MRRHALTAVILVVVMLGAFACSASEVEVTRVVELEVTREVEVPVEVIREVETVRETEVTREVKVTSEVDTPIEVEVTREIEVPVEVTREIEVTREVEVTRIVPLEVTKAVDVTREVEVTREVTVEVTREVIREVEVTREIPVTVEVTPTPTPIPSATPTPLPTPTPTVDVRNVDYVRDIEIPAEFVNEATNVAAAYCEGRTFSVSHEVNNHLGRFFFGFKAGTDECRADVLAAMAVRSKRMRETHTRYIFKGNKFRECYSDAQYNSINSQGEEGCGFVELYPARHLPEYDRERLIVTFEDQPPAYPFDYLLTQDELWARNQIWRSLIRYFHIACMHNAESTQGRVFYFDGSTYIGHLPNSIESWFHLGYTLPAAYWGTDGPDVGLCSAYDIKTRAEYEMWDYDLTYFGHLAIGVPNADGDPKPGSLNFAADLRQMRANPPEMPSRFAASGAGE